MAIEGEAATLVERHNCGVTATPSDPEAICEAVQALRNTPVQEREAMGAAGRRAYLQNYCSSVQVTKFETLLSDVTGQILQRPRQAA